MKQSIAQQRYLFLAVVLTAALGSSRAFAQNQQFYSLTPCRVVDTRSGLGGVYTFPASVERQFRMKNYCGVPPDAKTIALNLTALNPVRAGFLTLWPTGGVYTGTSVLNVTAYQPPIANGVIMKLGTGNPDLSVAYGSDNGGGTIDIIIDVFGYYK